MHKTLEFYNNFKTDYTSSDFVDLSRKSNERKELVQFRISNHKLMIEIGTMMKSREIIDSSLLVDQIKLKMKFLFDCPKYSILRNEKFKQVTVDDNS